MRHKILNQIIMNIVYTFMHNLRKMVVHAGSCRKDVDL